jgi:Asp/Glu/hydantoin racemase
MRVVMIHALAESIRPARLAFQEVSPKAEVVNLLDEGLLLDFKDKLTPALRRRMSQIICYCAEHGADGIGLACSVYTPMVGAAQDLVEVPLVSSYGPVISDALEAGPRVGIVASVPATLHDADRHLRKAAKERGLTVEPLLCLAEDLVPVMREEGEEGLRRRLCAEVAKLAPQVDVVLLAQFSLAAVLSEVRGISPVPVLSPPHSSARRLKELLSLSN